MAALFVDTFNGYFETENAVAAARLLNKAGYALYLVQKKDGAHCCGRTFLAAGMVEKARAKAAALVEDLAPLARANIAIVGLEPSCLLTLRDEALSLGLGESARTVSRQALLLEEFIAREAKAGRFSLSFQPAGAPILLHGHCHQRVAFGAVPAILDVLRLIPGAKPELIETSCCGMAGSFGYDHYDMSMQMAELKLLPAIRKRPEAIIVAGGTSVPPPDRRRRGPPRRQRRGAARQSELTMAFAGRSGRTTSRPACRSAASGRWASARRWPCSP